MGQGRGRCPSTRPGYAKRPQREPLPGARNAEDIYHALMTLALICEATRVMAQIATARCAGYG